MTATVTRSTDDVAADLAATFLATWKTVAATLAAQPPRIGRIEVQARGAFRAAGATWDRLVAPVVTDLIGLTESPQIPAADDYIQHLAHQVDVDAAAGLDLAMDLQIAKGIHPDVAWARAVAGYGLDAPTMRGYILAAIRVDKDGSTALLATSTKAAQQAVLTHAQRIGDREATAWATLPAPSSVEKRFDPTQTRDRNGQWEAEPTAGAMAQTLSEDTRTYPDVVWRPFTMNKTPRQVAARKAFEEQYGKLGTRLTGAVDDWINHPGVSRARHIEYGTHDRSPYARFKQYRLTPNHRLLIDAVNAAPPTKAPLFRGGSYTDVSLLTRGGVLNLPLTSFSATPAGAERFAWLGARHTNRTPVVFQLAPGAQALNLTPLTTWGSSPNEWIAHGRFKVTSTRKMQREIRFDPRDEHGKVMDILAVRVKQLPEEPAPVSKAGFDPEEQRDTSGRWGAGGAPKRKPVRVKERVRVDDGLDEMLRNVPVDTAPVAAPVKAKAKVQAPVQAPVKAKVKAKVKAPVKVLTPVKAPVQAPVKAATKVETKVAVDTKVAAPAKVANPYAVTANPYANPYAVAANPYANPYAVTANPYAVTANPYAANPYAVNPYAAVPAAQAARNTYIFVGPMPGTVPAKTPWRASSVPEDVGRNAPGDENLRPDYGMYLAENDMRHYRYLHGFGSDYGAGSNNSFSVVDFYDVAEHYETVRAEPNPGQITEATSPWDVVKGLSYVDRDDWSAVLKKAVPVFDAVQADPVEAANRRGVDLSVVAERCGYPFGMDRGTILADIEANFWMREHDVETFWDANENVMKESNPGLLAALADYITWNKPEVMGDKGEALAQEMEDRLDRGELDSMDVPGVFTFDDGLADDDKDNAGDLRGRYNITYVQYHSAIQEHRYSAPPGKTGLREVYLKPEGKFYTVRDMRDRGRESRDPRSGTRPMPDR